MLCPAHLAVWQDGACRVAQERDVPQAAQAHEHRQVLAQRRIAEVAINGVGALHA